MLAFELPYKLGLMLAGVLGIAVGTFLEGRKSRSNKSEEGKP
jgi:hypothetical protein